MTTNSMEVHERHAEPWRVTLIDTGEETMTGGRIKRISKYVCEEEAFCLTYGDGVSNVNVSELISFHKTQGKLATLTATYPPGRFGALEMDKDIVKSFQEKPKGDGAMINGGFFVLSPKVIDLIADDSSIWEKEPLESLSSTKQLSAFRHQGFWQPMDTLRDKVYLEQLWASGEAPWKVWS